MKRDLRLTFVVESGTDIRLVEGLDRNFLLDVVCRDIRTGFHINWKPRSDLAVTVGPSGRIAFAIFLARWLAARPPPDILLVQGYAAAALMVNIIARLRDTSPVMLVCSPVEAYYECRRHAGDPSAPFRRREMLGLKALARLNAAVGRDYVVLSSFLRDVVLGHGARGAIEVVPVYGVDLERFAPSREDKARLRSSLGLP